MYVLLVVINLWIKSDPGNRKNLVGIKRADTLFGCNKSCESRELLQTTAMMIFHNWRVFFLMFAPIILSQK